MALNEDVGRAVQGARPTLANSFGTPVLTVEAASVAAVLGFLRDDPGQAYDMLVDITAVDRLATEGGIDVVYNICSLTSGRRLTVKTRLTGQDPTLPTVTGLWKAAGWAEREVYDMFGVRFDGHPDLRRILMYEGFEGSPLLKSYPVDKRQPLVAERDPIADPWPSKDGL